MDRIKQLALNRSKRLTDPGAHMYHAATGVADSGSYGNKKRERLKKQFARLRKMKKEFRDEGTHRYMDQGKDGSVESDAAERESRGYLARS
jgi:hypothetical protein